jgi:hypothetical protein
MRNWLYGLAFVVGYFTALYSVKDEDTGDEVVAAYLEGVQYGAKEATLNSGRCNWKHLFTQEK